MRNQQAEEKPQVSTDERTWYSRLSTATNASRRFAGIRLTVTARAHNPAVLTRSFFPQGICELLEQVRLLRTWHRSKIDEQIHQLIRYQMIPSKLDLL